MRLNSASLFALILLLKAATCIGIHNGQHIAASTPDQWLDEYTCNERELARSEQQKSAWARVWSGDECDRDPSRWQMNYVDEIKPWDKSRGNKSNLLIIDNSLDARLANSLNLVKQMRQYDSYGLRVHPGGHRQQFHEQLLGSVAGGQVDDRVCGEHLSLMLGLIDDLSGQLEANRRMGEKPRINLNESHFHLARVLDSFGRYESGYFSGRQHSMGAYDQCQAGRLMLGGGSSAVTVGTRYCWAHLNLTRHLHPSLVGKRMSKYVFEGNFLNIAMCLPHTCHTKSFHGANRHKMQQLVNQQFKLPRAMYLEESLELSAIYCLVDESSEYLKLSIGAKLFLLTLAGWLLASTYATFFATSSSFKDRPLVHALLTHLNLKDSWNELLCQPRARNESNRGGSAAGAINLDSLNSIKIILYTQILIGHALATTFAYSTNILRAASISDNSLLPLVARVYFLTVEVFFTISGLLVGYIEIKQTSKWLNQTRRDKSSNGVENTGFGLEMKQLASLWTKMAASRYIRVVPFLFVLSWFEKTLYIHLGSGPMWDHGLDNTTMLGGCLRTSWLRPFNFVTPVEDVMNCVTSAWYIYCDLFAHVLFVPPLVYLFASGRAKMAYSITISLITLSTLGAGLKFAKLNGQLTYELRQLEFFTIMMRGEQWQIYMNPFFRLPRVLIGVLAGHVLYWYSYTCNSKTGSGSPKVADGGRKAPRSLVAKWPAWVRGPATWLAVIMITITILPTLFMVQVKRHMYPDYYSLAFQSITISPLIWCTSVVIVLLRLVTDWQTIWLARMGTNRLIQALNKLGFIVYLIHWYIYIYYANTKTSEAPFSERSLMSNLGMVIFHSLLISALLFVFIENPLRKLLKHLLPI